MWFLFGIIVVSVASLWGTPHLLRSAPEEQAKQRVSTIDRISRLFLLRRRASKAPVTEAPWSVPVVRRNPLYGVHEADLGAGQRRFSADIDDRPVSFIGEDDDIRSDPKTMHAARLDVEEAPLDVPEERHREGNETPYGFGSLEDLRHVGDRPADLEEDREEDLEESQEEEEVLGFGDLHPATDEGVDASAAGESPHTRHPADRLPQAEGVQQTAPIEARASLPHPQKTGGVRDNDAPFKAGDEEEILEEKYTNPPMTTLHIHSGNIGLFLDGVPTVRQLVGLFVEMPLSHLSDIEWKNFKQIFKGFRFDMLSEIVFAFQGANARILSLLLEVLPDHIPMKRLALIESRVDGHNQVHFADLMSRAQAPFHLSFIYRGGRVPEVLGLMGSLQSDTQEKVKAVEWRDDQTNPMAFRHLRSMLMSFNERMGSVVQTSF